MASTKITSVFTPSKRLIKLESEMFDILKESTKPLNVVELKSFFPNRASLETTRSMINDSSIIKNLDNDFATTYVIYARIDYTIEGANIKEIYLGGEPGSTSGGTVSMAEMGPDYEFQLVVIQKNNETLLWTFNTTSIITNDGTRRKLGGTEQSALEEYSDILNTYEL